MNWKERYWKILDIGSQTGQQSIFMKRHVISQVIIQISRFNKYFFASLPFCISNLSNINVTV